MSGISANATTMTTKQFAIDCCILPPPHPVLKIGIALILAPNHIMNKFQFNFAEKNLCSRKFRIELNNNDRFDITMRINRDILLTEKPLNR